MDNKKQFLQELHDLLDKYQVEISIGLDGDTHGLDSWIEIMHQPNPKINKYETIITFNDGCVGAYELKQHIPLDVEKLVNELGLK
jgi:hypothetical protein